MEIASIDEYGPQSDPAGMGAGHGHVQGVGIGVPTGRHSSASPLTNEDDNMSDREDDGSGEELPQQPLQNNSHSSNPLGAPDEHPEPSVSPLARPHFMDSYLAKIKVEPPTSEPSNVSITSKSSLEAFQAAMANGFQLPLHFNPAFLAGAGAPGAPSLPSHLQSHMPFVFRDAAGLAGMTPGNAPGTPGSNGNGPVIGTPGNAPGNNPQQQMSSNSSNISEESTGSQKDSKSGILAQGQITPTGTGGQSQQPNNWSFEEQFKQLYEINNDPKRKEFLDDLFSFMQKKGTPINRLPIMAKQVLDLYELYNLVITRGGLVEVINKKMWQEIIKGLHLPSSITSAAFTLRTQYMKYLYPYECAKLKLSTDSELQSAIDGNRREGRRTTYGTPMGYQGSPGDMLQHTNHRIHGNPQGLVGMQGLPMSLVNAVSHAAATNRADHDVSSHHLLNGSGVHAPMPHHPHATPGQTPSLQTEQLTEYLQMMLQSRLPQVERTAMAIAAENQNNRPDSTSPNPEGRSPVHHSHMPDPNIIRSLNLFSAMQYQNRAFPLVQHATSPEHQLESPPAASPEPQREALDLGLRTSSNSSSPEHHSPPAVASSSISLKRDIDQVASPATMNYKKANLELEHSQQENNTPRKTHITNRERDNSMAVSMEVNGVLYEGVLYPKQRNQNNGTSRNGSSNNDNDTSRDAS